MRQSQAHISLVALATFALVGCAGEEAVPPPTPPSRALLEPGSDSASLTAPELFRAKFETSKGDFTVEVHRDWAPHGADRFYYLAKNGFYDHARFFRVVPGFVAQFGISWSPEVSAAWQGQEIPDDPVVESNLRGRLTYAMAGPDTRNTQVFINYADNAHLDENGFAPFGQVVEGMEVVDSLHAGYGQVGLTPDQKRLREEGNAYLDAEFPLLDYITRVTVIEQGG
ncbi:MAG: peptidylprolyl isomerase [Gemmatimonadales bacterium]